MNCYDLAPEFITEDNRQFRTKNPVSAEQMAAKHEALLPPHFIHDKTILDLGCCLGATGHWCLTYGAKHYTGVEVQEGYHEIARKLLNKYHPGKFTLEQTSIEQFLARPLAQPFDVVCLLGVIYVFTDYYSILKGCTQMTRETFVIDAMHPNGALQNDEFCGVQFIEDQGINMAGVKISGAGRGTRISPRGMQWIMADFGFYAKEGMLFTRPVNDGVDVYNRPTQPNSRYLMRFERESYLAPNVSDRLRSGNFDKTFPF